MKVSKTIKLYIYREIKWTLSRMKRVYIYIYYSSEIEN